MKKILMSLGTLVFAGAVVIGGTGALFVDQEVSSGNVFAAGSVDLEITDITHQGNHPDEVVGFTLNQDGISFSFDDLKPRDIGTVTFDIENLDNDAYLCARVMEEGNAENVRLDQETAAGDGTPNIGELQNFLQFRFDGEVGSLAEASGIWTEVAPGAVPGGTTLPASFDYCFGTFNGLACETDINDLTINQAQTDSVTAKVEFYAIQSRNNPDFSCDSLNEPDGPVVTPGNLLSEESAGMRVKAQGGEGIYLGEGDLGVPANRVQTSIGSMNNGTGEYPFTLAYTSATNEVTLSGPNGANLTWDVDNAPVTCSAWDALRISVRDSRNDSALALSDVELNGNPLGDFGTFSVADQPGELFWTVTGIDFLADWTVTGDIDIETFKGNEASRMSVTVGCL